MVIYGEFEIRCMSTIVVRSRTRAWYGYYAIAYAPIASPAVPRLMSSLECRVSSSSHVIQITQVTKTDLRALAGGRFPESILSHKVSVFYDTRAQSKRGLFQVLACVHATSSPAPCPSTRPMTTFNASLFFYHRVGADAIGWCIEVLDVPGELAPYLLPESEAAEATVGGGGDDWTPSRADSNKWYRVTIVDRVTVENERFGAQPTDHGYDDAGVGDRQNVDTALGRGGRGGELESKAEEIKAGTEVGLPLSSSSTVFLVLFESGRTARLDLADFSIRWIAFHEGGAEEQQRDNRIGGDGMRRNADVRGADGGRGDTNGNEGGRKASAKMRLPPGFGEGPRGGWKVPHDCWLARDDTDVGTRIDVWWPRYNSFFRATVRKHPVY